MCSGTEQVSLRARLPRLGESGGSDEQRVAYDEPGVEAQIVHRDLRVYFAMAWAVKHKAVSTRARAGTLAQPSTTTTGQRSAAVDSRQRPAGAACADCEYARESTAERSPSPALAVALAL